MSCYDKYKSDADVAARQKCMYTASGDMLCGVQGDGVNVILKNTPFQQQCNTTTTTTTPNKQKNLFEFFQNSNTKQEHARQAQVPHVQAAHAHAQALHAHAQAQANHPK